MSRVEHAAQRVEDALHRLEQAIASRPAVAEGASDDELADQLRQTQAEFAELQVVTAEVSERLDVVIERLKRALED